MVVMSQTSGSSNGRVDVPSTSVTFNELSLKGVFLSTIITHLRIIGRGVKWVYFFWSQLIKSLGMTWWWAGSLERLKLDLGTHLKGLLMMVMCIMITNPLIFMLFREITMLQTMFWNIKGQQWYSIMLNKIRYDNQPF